MSLEDYESLLDTYVNDDDKLVTYKWLSKELEIQVNQAKSVLKMYWEKHKTKQEMVATFMLIGQLKTGPYHVTVVKDCDLDTAKESFESISSEHVYSIQKTLSHVELLATAGEGDLRFSMIKVKKQPERSQYAHQTIPRSVKENKESQATIETENTKSKETSSNKVEFSEGKKSPDKSKPNTPPKKNTQSIDSSEKTKTSANKTTATSKTKSDAKSSSKVSKKPVQSKQSGFNNLFAKVPNNSVKKTIQNESQISSKTKEDKHSNETNSPVEDKSEKIMESKIDKKQEKESQQPGKKSIFKEDKPGDKISNKKIQESHKDKKETAGSQKKENKPEKKQNVKRKKKNADKDDDSLKKRRRIVVASDSSDNESKSSDEESEEPMQVEEPPSPPKVKPKRPASPLEKVENGKRMVRKSIDKTFKDEDGYFVTKRVYVYEETDDTQDLPSAPEILQKPKPKPVEAKKKQSNLMSFFKKT